MHLIIVEGPGRGQRLVLGNEPVRIGRDPTNDLIIDDTRASRHHAEVIPLGDDSWLLRDGGSRNGTLLNDEIVDYYWNFTITRDLIELRNIALLATLIVECASRRKESRGLHYTIDYPNQEKGWCRDTILTDVKGLKGPPMAQGPLLTKSMPE